ncbi:MAG: L-lactate dehydrogenase [Chlamydiota bacterium]
MRFFDQPLPRFPLTSVSDYRLLAKKRLPRQLFEFLDGGAFDEVTIGRNRQDFQQVQLKRRILQNVSDIHVNTNLFEQELDFPLILAPVGFAGTFARRGEIQAATAASKANIPFSLSTVSICSVEEVSQHSSTPFWFQFYMFKDRAHSLDLLQRASAAQCPVLLLTVDLPVAGARYRYHRSRRRSSFSNFLDAFIHPSWWVDVRLRGGPLTIGNIPISAPALSQLSDMRKWMGSQLSQSFSWKDFEWVRAHWKGKIIIKGILDSQDALMAHSVGADGIVVSNHGGRHLDGISSSIAALPAICDVVKGDLKILLDGGITSGLDIVKALAIGADACMIGKPWMYGLASRGEQGVSEVITILKNELKIVMAHLGVSSIEEINRKLIQ